METDKVQTLLSLVEQNNKAIDELINENSVLNNILAKNGYVQGAVRPTGTDQVPLFSSKNNTGILKTAQVIKQEFVNNPNKEFSPAELRDILLDYIKSGKVSTSAKNVLYAVHTALRALVSRGAITKIQLAERDSVYKFKK